jgi:hypothetical protein
MNLKIKRWLLNTAIRFSIACAGAGFGFSFVSAASAESAAVLMPYTRQASELQLADQVLDSIAKWLKERGIEVVLPEQAAQQLPSDLRYCRKDDCAFGYLQQMKVDYAVLSAVQAPATQKSVGNIHICILTRDKQKYEKSWAITESIWLSVDAALTHVYTSFLRGPAPWISVQGKPTGADVLIDGQKVGLLPYRERVRAGRHEVTIRRNGYKPYSVYVVIEDNINFEKGIEVALQKTGEETGLNGSAGAKTSGSNQALFSTQGVGDEDRHPKGAKINRWNYVIGGLLVAASAPLIIFPIATTARGDDCAVGDVTNCRGSKAGPTSVALLTGGMVALAAGAFFLLVRPMTE